MLSTLLPRAAIKTACGISLKPICAKTERSVSRGLSDRCRPRTETSATTKRRARQWQDPPSSAVDR
eukprot:9497518-Pyramimonas_sp.AAC.1